MIRFATLKALISLIFFIGTVPALADPQGSEFTPEFEITNVMSTFFFFNTKQEVQDAWNELFPDLAEEYDPEFHLEGFSNCEHYVEQNFAHCDIYVMRPTVVDGENTLTAGHEVFHGVYGSKYHVTVW